MEYEKLGRANVRVSKLCLGTMNFGMVTEEREAFGIMDCAIDAGINFFDTANSYGGYNSRGLTESIIGKWIKNTGKRNHVFLADKVYHLSEKFFFNINDEVGLSSYKIKHHIECSLRRLCTDHIDLYHMHHVDREASWAEVWPELSRLYYAGKISYVGSSNFTAYDIAVCNRSTVPEYPLGLVSEQHKYNLLCRLPELEVIPACEREKMALLVWGPLDAGRLSDHPFDKLERTRASHNSFDEIQLVSVNRFLDFCRENNLNPAHVAISWLLKNPNVTSVIIGPRTLSQLQSCIKATELDITPYLKEINRIFPSVGGRAPEVYAW